MESSRLVAGNSKGFIGIFSNGFQTLATFNLKDLILTVEPDRPEHAHKLHIQSLDMVGTKILVGTKVRNVCCGCMCERTCL